VPLCKENVGMAGADNLQMYLRPDPLNIFGLCWLVQFMSKDGKQKCGRIKRKLKEIEVSVVQTMRRGVRTKLRKIADNRPLAIM
jgi:hypothetical protein